MSHTGWSQGQAISLPNLNRNVRWSTGTVWEENLYDLNLVGQIDLVRLHKGRALEAAEIEARHRIITGAQNGSQYPEAGSGLAQYWAFMRLAEYFFASQAGAAWDILDHWLTWLDAYGQVDGPGWKIPTYFSEYGFGYGDYDPGCTAAVAIGCLYISMRTGDSRAGVWADRILTDLRENRQSGEFGGHLYKSDYHYGWLNAMVAHAFGLAAAGRRRASHPFPSDNSHRDHFIAMVNRFFQLSGDSKPNVLNREGIPFTLVEDADVWDYAPHYLALRQMGSLEALVLMLQAAADYGVLEGDWGWFDRLLGFMLTDNLVTLNGSQLRQVSLTYDTTTLKNLVRIRYADYDRDNDHYAEARREELITELGQLPMDLDLRYGRPVICEDPVMASLLAQRWLTRQSHPRELVTAETWWEGARIELGDTVALSSDFHNLDQTEYQCCGKVLSLESGRVQLQLQRQISYYRAWAVDAAGTAFDAAAIEARDPEGVDWPYRSYVY